MGKESFASCRDGSTHVFNVLPLPGGTLGSPTALHAKRFGRSGKRRGKQMLQTYFRSSLTGRRPFAAG